MATTSKTKRIGRVILLLSGLLLAGGLAALLLPRPPLALLDRSEDIAGLTILRAASAGEMETIALDHAQLSALLLILEETRVRFNGFSDGIITYQEQTPGSEPPGDCLYHLCFWGYEETGDYRHYPTLLYHSQEEGNGALYVSPNDWMTLRFVTSGSAQALNDYLNQLSTTQPQS